MTAPARILLVDDDADYAESLRLIFESHGYQFNHAVTVAQGLAMALEIQPDLIVLDVVFANQVEGFTFAQTLRTKNDYKTLAQIPILTLTSMRKQQGYIFPQPPHQAVFTPRDEFLEKPVQTKLLLNTVEDLLLP